MMLVFTDDDGRVVRRHSRPERLTEAQRGGGIEVPREAFDGKPSVAPWERARPYVVEGELEWRKEPRQSVDAFMDRLDDELGRKTVREILKNYPDLERALARERYARAWAGLGDAREDGAIDGDTLDTIERLAQEHGIPRPEDG